MHGTALRHPSSAAAAQYDPYLREESSLSVVGGLSSRSRKSRIRTHRRCPIRTRRLRSRRGPPLWGLGGLHGRAGGVALAIALAFTYFIGSDLVNT